METDDGTFIDGFDVSYLARENLRFDGPILGLQWGPKWLAIGTRDQTLLLAPCSRESLRGYFVICDGQNSDLLRLVGDGLNRAGTAKFSKDGTWMVTGSFGSSVKRWNLSAAGIDRQWESDGKLAMANAFAISQDMSVVAAGIGGSKVQLIDPSSGITLSSVEPPIGADGVPRGTSTAIAFNPNDLGMFATAYLDGSIVVWENWKGNAVPIELKGTGETAYQLGFSADGSFLASASDDGIVRLWATESMKTDTPAELRGHKGPVWAIAISPDGKHIASGSADKLVVLWNRHSAFRRGGDQEPSSDNRPADTPLAGATTSICTDGLPVPPDFGSVTACLQTRNHRTVVASAKGQLEVFNKDRVPVDAYRVESDVTGLEFDGYQLVINSHTKSVKRPFFDDLNALISYSLNQLPFAGTKQVTLPREVLCTLQDMNKDCDPERWRGNDELSLPPIK